MYSMPDLVKLVPQMPGLLHLHGSPGPRSRVVQMYMVNPGGRGVQQLAASVELEGAQPVKLHGGNLLAVGTSQQLKSGV